MFVLIKLVYQRVRRLTKGLDLYIYCVHFSVTLYLKYTYQDKDLK